MKAGQCRTESCLLLEDFERAYIRGNSLYMNRTGPVSDLSDGVTPTWVSARPQVSRGALLISAVEGQLTVELAALIRGRSA